MEHALVVFGHPNSDSFSHALGEAYAGGLRRAGLEVGYSKLSELEFDPVLRSGFGGEQPLEPDLQDTRDAIARASLVAWFFPTWWAGPPALLKGFIERTFLPGWAFSFGAGEESSAVEQRLASDYRAVSALPVPLLKGREARVVTTMDSPGWWYALWHWRAVHAAFVNATLRFCGFRVRSETLFGLRNWTAARRARALTRLEALGYADGSRLLKRRARLPQPVKQLAGARENVPR